MNGALLVVAYVSGLNPLRCRLGIPETMSRRVRAAPLAAGSLLAWGAIVVLAWFSGPLLEWLEITPETFRIAAGFTLALCGLYVLARPVPPEEPVPGGWWPSLWPVAFPRLLGPEMLALSVTTGSKEGVAATAVAAAVALSLLGLLGPVARRETADRVLLHLGRLVAVALLVVAVWLLIEGIRDV
jgi:small neutral amino acid transporter SnatA (MarC family)